MQTSPPRPYHHGNLKEALLAAAVALIGEVGPRAFTLRELARRAGVSHNAPYRHFKDKDELLAAVAAQGFERLTASMQQSAGEGTTALDRLCLCGRGYIQFALEWPQHFLVMFDLHYAAAGSAAFETLLACIADSQKEGALPEGDPRPLALTAWSMVHGFAKLAIGGWLQLESAQVLDFASYAAQAVAQGMANLPHPSVVDGDTP